MRPCDTWSDDCLVESCPADADALMYIASPAHPLRRSLIKSQISNTSLEAKVFALEQRIKQKDEDLESRRVEIEQLKQDRRNLNKGYTDALNVRDDVKAQFDSATVSRRN